MFCTNCGKEISDASEFCTFCGSAVTKKPAEQKSIQVTFNRLKKIVGCAVPMRVYIDGVQVVSLSNGASGQVNVTSGKHKVVVEMWSAISEREVDFSAEYSKMYIDIAIKMGFWVSKAEIVAIRNEK